jgi:hypothetical protein
MRITIASKSNPSNVSYKKGLILGVAGFFLGIFLAIISIIIAVCLPFAALAGKIRKES